MTEGQIFQRGYRVRILSRFPPGVEYAMGGEFQNTGVGQEAIIEYSSIERPKEFHLVGHYGLCYSILILWDNRTVRSIKWFEERFLELICCNEVKGEKILKENNIPREA